MLSSNEGVKVGLSGGGTHRVKLPLPGPDGLGDVGKHGGGNGGAGLGGDLLGVGQGGGGSYP